jgi:hypothetical protein
MFYYSHHINKYVCVAYFLTLVVLLFYTISNLLLVSLNKSFAEKEKHKDHQKLQVKSLANKPKLFTNNKPLTERKPSSNSVQYQSELISTP